MTDKSEGPGNPYEHEDCDDITGCGDKCKVSAWEDGYSAGFKAGLERAEKLVETMNLPPQKPGWWEYSKSIREEIEKI